MSDTEKTRLDVGRVSLVAAGVVALGVAVAFLVHWPEVVRVWPFMSYGMAPVFLAAMLVAIAAPMLWIGVSGELAAVRGGAADVFVTMLGLGVYCVVAGWDAHPGRQRAFGLLCIGVAAVALLLLYTTRRQRMRDDRPTPMPVRYAFGAFTVLLVAAGAALMARQPVFPWRLDWGSSVAYGLMFIGAAIYFAWGLARPVWGNAKGQLLGLLAHDVVLVVPFARLWLKAPGVSLSVYLGVIAVSGVFAIWYLLLSPQYRLRR